MASAILVVIICLFLFAPVKLIEFLLAGIKYHPWILSMSVAMFLALYTWLAYMHYYRDDPEDTDLNES